MGGSAFRRQATKPKGGFRSLPPKMLNRAGRLLSKFFHLHAAIPHLRPFRLQRDTAPSQRNKCAGILWVRLLDITAGIDDPAVDQVSGSILLHNHLDYVPSRSVLKISVLDEA